MTAKFPNEKQWFNLVGGIAILNNCQHVDIDQSKKTIHVSGSQKAIRAWSVELERLMERSEGAVHACFEPE